MILFFSLFLAIAQAREQYDWITQLPIQSDQQLFESNQCVTVTTSSEAAKRASRKTLEHLCSEPAAVICDPQLNPVNNDLTQVYSEFNNLLDQAEHSAQVKAFLKKFPGKTACSSLKVGSGDYARCIDLVHQSMAQKLFTPIARKKAVELFEKARKALLQTLEARVLWMATSRTSIQAQKHLKKMIQIIKKAQLVLPKNSIVRGEEFEFNAYARRPGQILLEGMVMLVQQYPEVAYHTYLHELSHLVDPSFYEIKNQNWLEDPFKKDDTYRDHPFQRELLCLHRVDSVAARSADPRCYDRLAQKYLRTKPALSLVYQAIANAYRENPDLPLQVPAPAEDDERCPEPQVGEAFADWLETEALVQSQRENWMRNKRPKYFSDIWKNPKLMALLSAGVVNCDAYAYEISPKITRSQNLDHHPLTSDRINHILFAHPIIKEALGCPKDSIRELDHLKSSPQPGKAVYCGQQLWRGAQ